MKGAKKKGLALVGAVARVGNGLQRDGHRSIPGAI